MKHLELQRAFAAHIRDPAHCPPPAGIDDRRLQVYRDLVLDNFSGLLAGSFPVLHAIAGRERWQGLLRSFLRDYRCRSPLFPELPQEFVAWLRSSPDGVREDLPFADELAHYEWVETALDLAPTKLPESGFDPAGNLLDEVPLLSPLAWPLAYLFPVHRLSLTFRPLEPPGERSCFVAWRNGALRVQFLAVSPATLRLVELLQAPGGMSGRELLRQIASKLPREAHAQVAKGGAAALESLRSHGVILGTLRRA